MKYILFSHGFGVKKDSRGMFTEIANNFSKYTPVMFDYNRISGDGQEVAVEPYSKQAIVLKSELLKIYKQDKTAEVTLIGHSQGCIIPCLLRSIKLQKAILLAPPLRVGSKMRANQKAQFEADGSIRIPRKDGTTTIVTKAFIEELDDASPEGLYKDLASRVDTTIIVANQDEILKYNDFSSMDNLVSIIMIDGDHNFTGDNREGLIKTLSRLLD